MDTIKENSRTRSSATAARAAVIGFVVTLMGLVGGAAANAATPAPPDPNDAIGATASGLSTGIVSSVTQNIPYVVAVLVMFTVIGAVRRHLGAKKG